MCPDAGKVLSPLRPVLSLGLSVHPAKGGMCHQGFWGGISAFESLGLRFGASCAPSSYASSIRSELPPRALRCISLLAWHRVLPSRGPGDGVVPQVPLGRGSPGAFSRLHCPSRALGQAEGRGVCLEIEL